MVIYKVLLSYSHTHLFVYYFWLLMTNKAKLFITWPFLRRSMLTPALNYGAYITDHFASFLCFIEISS